LQDDESVALAELAGDGNASDDTPDDGEPDLLAADETDDGESDLFAEDEASSGVADSSLAPRIRQAPPEVARSSQTVVVAAAPAAAQSPAEFPVTKYEYDPNSGSGSITTSDAAASAALAATAEDAPALADTDGEPVSAAVAVADQEYTDIPRPGDMLAASDRELPTDAKPEPLPPLTDPSDLAPPKDTPKVDGGGAKPAEPKPVAAAHSPEVSCPPTTIQLEPGRFDFDKWVLRPQAKEKLDAVAAKLKDNRCEAVNIIGHTDRIGSNKYNQRLSERRANAAKDYLVKKHGIAENLITAIGKGESELITKAADCKGKRKKALIACYGPDRRVEVTVRTK
jgi:outer membrane protein OmpA-like peptidoglycan-associated protein